MGKRTSQTSSPSQPRARRKHRSLLGSTVRIVAIVVVVFAVVFLAAGWFYSGEIESGALEPPKSGPPDYPWQVTESGSTVSLVATPSTDQAGERGLSGLRWDGGYAQSEALVRSEDTDAGWLDVRSLAPGEQGPAVDTDVSVDFYYWRGTPADIGLDYETVRYTSDAGTFPAWFIDGPSDTWAIVVHGKGGTAEEALRVIPILHERGYPILVIDYRNDVGQPRDPSGYFTYGVSDWADVAAAVRYANENGATNHILVGYSYAGSMISSYLTQSPLRNFTTAAILDSPVLSLTDAVDFRASNSSLPIIPASVPQVLTDVAKWISTWRFDIDWDATNYLDQTSNLHTPMLIFHGTEDISVPISTSREMAQLRPDLVTLVENDSGHTRSWNIGPDEYAAAINAFLDEQE